MKREESLLDIARRALQERRERVASLELSLSGQAVELWRAGDRYFLVADETDARLVVERKWGSRGEVWTAGEVEVVARIADQAMRDEIAQWKRTCDGKVRPV
jgi:hypothetical protein